VNSTTGTLWPGNGILALANSPTTLFAELFREGSGTNRHDVCRFLRGRHHLVEPRDDRRRRSVRSSGRPGSGEHHRGEPGVPESSAGHQLRRLRRAVHVEQRSPRAGLTYALDESRKTVARLSYARFAGQLDSGSVGYMNPASSAGAAIYRWIDLNSDHFAQANESR